MTFNYNPHVKHPDQLRTDASGFSDKLAKRIEPIFGSMRAFYLLISWQMLWIILAVRGIGFFKHDPYPFTFLLFLSNLYQLWALPILGYLTKKSDRRRQEAERIKNTADHEALTHIANQLDRLVSAQLGGDENEALTALSDALAFLPSDERTA